MPESSLAQKNEFLIKPVKRKRLYAMLKAILPQEEDESELSPNLVSRITPVQTLDRSSLRILVCEDNPINVKVAKHLLKRLGCVPDIAEDGQCGLETCKEKQYDLILYALVPFDAKATTEMTTARMDMQMPRMNGWQATRAIRLLPNYKHTPIYAMTANGII